MRKFDQNEIVDYYERCETNYRRWWDLDRSLAMHAGYWDGTTHNLQEALTKENEVLAGIAGIKAEDKVLDAGCGFGGSSLYLAQQIGCKVIGITLSARQVDVAMRKAKSLNVSNRPEFLVMDYISTSFDNDSFDVVWAIESVCHAGDKQDFLREAKRILKPGGRLILADGFNVRNEYTPGEKTLLAKAVNGWAVESMESIPNFDRFLNEQGYIKINKMDITQHVLPSSRRLFFYSFPAIALSKLGEYFGWSSRRQTQDFVCYHYQYWAVRKKLCRYMIFSAQKPS